ncbi:bifunctional glycosyltransferase/class I SAM-dependent methyltransferase [Eubacterium oxidoreducens]|nr:bifunctional glycosyltransferase/class I SAM-dependent methyltransferase [Eubacterium oxidoreducens]
MNEIVRKIEQGDYDEAQIALEAYMEEHPFTADIAVLGATIAEGQGQKEEMFACIRLGLESHPDNYELYYLMGNYYRYENPRVALLYYKLSVSLCNCRDDKEFLQETYDAYLKESGEKPPQTTILYLTHDSEQSIKSSMKALEENIDVHKTEVIAIDNGSTDKSVEILKKYPFVTVIENEHPVGIAKCINQGIKKAQKEHDIYLIQAEFRLTKNSFQMLQIGAYANEKIGAAGSVSNHFVNYQGDTNLYADEQKSQRQNIPAKNYYEVKTYLALFSLYLKREVIDKIGGFDESLEPAGNVDEDYGIRILKAGYQNYLCYNSYVYRLSKDDTGSVIRDWKYEPGQYRSFREKWGFLAEYFSASREDLMMLINRQREEEIHFLEVGCTSGETLCRLQYLYPNASVYGVELNEQVAKIGACKTNILCGNIESMELPYEKGYFDYIIFGDVLEHLAYPEETLIRMKDYLKEGGCILTSIPNLLHGDVLYDLLRGNFTYREYGILDRTHLRFFTEKEIFRMFARCGYEIDALLTTKTRQNPTDNHLEFFKALFEIAEVSITKNQVNTFQYLVRARKK